MNLKVFDYQTNTNISLERKNDVKYLGVLIDETLSWKYHIIHLASKISKTIGIIARLRQFVPLATLHHIYISCLLYTSPSPRDQRGSRMPSSA